MDLEHVQRLAQAFAQGVAFARGFTEMAQDAKDGEEDGHWVTIGGERGEDGRKHGGRPVFISGNGTIKKGLSRNAQGKTLGQVFGKGGEFSSEGKQSKPAQQRNESKKSETKTKTKKSETPRAGLLTEQGSSLAQLAEREYDKVITAIKDDISSIESDPTFPPEAKRYETVPIKSNLRNIKSELSDVNKDLSTVKDEVSKAVKDGNFNRQGVESVWRAMKQLKDRAAYVVSHTNSETAWLGRNNTRGMTETAETLNRLSNEASGIRQDANRLKEEVRGSIAQFERENANTPETRTYSAKDPLYAARGKVINGPAKANTPANAGALTEKGKALADLVKKEYGKVENKIRQDFAQTHKDIDKFSDPAFKIPGVNFGTEVRIKSGLNTIKNYTEALADQINMTAKEVAHAAEYDDFNRAGVENVWSKIKQIEKKAMNLAGRTDTAMHGLGWMSTNGHEDAARDITKLKDEAIKLDRESYDLYHEAIDAIRQYSRSRQE